MSWTGYRRATYGNHSMYKAGTDVSEPATRCVHRPLIIGTHAGSATKKKKGHLIAQVALPTSPIPHSCT
jgi:hypothetical protein